eukprot:TRINITY_DN14703_c0_g1_i1.p1 TRINITY_DN14703_c0_g1~~TRINITY_DN14703_c0_g1_i1.p1  ORF type:complete len:159 (+),score=35.35 TRINITY_DN14703_c0_g1_i1:56-532(+)
MSKVLNSDSVVERYIEELKKDDSERDENILLQCVKSLSERDLKNKEKNMLLITIKNKKFEHTKYILQNLRGYDVNVKDNKGNNPLIYSCIYNNPELFQLLLEKNADLFQKNERQDAAFSYSTVYPQLYILATSHVNKLKKSKKKKKKLLSMSNNNNNN